MKKIIALFSILLLTNSLVAQNNDSIQEKLNKNDSDDEVYTEVEEMPEFPGGQAEMMLFIKTNMQYPLQAKKKGWQGKVFLKFVVNKEGKIINPIILKSSGYQILDNEALRMINTMPKWKPGNKDGLPVNVWFLLPLKYALS